MILSPKQTITIVQEAYGLVTKMEEIKYSKKYDRAHADREDQEGAHCIFHKVVCAIFGPYGNYYNSLGVIFLSDMDCKP